MTFIIQWLPHFSRLNVGFPPEETCVQAQVVSCGIHGERNDDYTPFLKSCFNFFLSNHYSVCLFVLARQPPVGQGLLIHEVAR